MQQADNKSTVLDTVVFGDEQLTERCARVLVANGHRVRALVTANTDIEAWAVGQSINVVDPADPNLAQRLADTPYQYLFSVANLRVLDDDVLATAGVAAVNFHDGPLPHYAGLHATTWALLNGETEHGVTWHLIDSTAAVDTGDILLQQSVTVEPTETAHSLNVKCAEAGMESFARLVDQLSTGTQELTAQDTSARSYFGKWQRPSGLGILDWTQPASALEKQVRALQLGSASTNRIGRATLMLDREVLLCRSVSAEKAGSAGGAETDRVPGTVLVAEESSLRVATIDGDLVIFELEAVDGTPISLPSVFEQFDLGPGSVLPTLSSGQRERLDDVAAEFTWGEPYWTRRLSQFSPVNLPYASNDNRDSCGGDTGDGVDVASVFEDSIEPQTMAAAAAALFLVRLTGDQQFGIALSCDLLDAIVDDLPAVWSDTVPWLIDVQAATSTADMIAETAAELSSTLAKGTYQRDLIARTPALTASNTPPTVRVHLGDQLPDCGDDRANVTFLVRPDGSYRLRRSSTISGTDLDRLATHLDVFVNGIAADPVQPVGHVTLLDETELDRIIRQWNDTTAHYEPTSIIELFAGQANAHPNKCSVIAGAGAATYGELDRRSSQLAGHLAATGVGDGSIVAIALPRGEDLVTVVLGVLKTGAAYLPLDPDYPRDRLAFMLEDSMASTVVTTSALADLLPDVSVTDVSVTSDGTSAVATVLIDQQWDAIEQAQPLAAPADGIDPAQLAYLIYTSGSTGRPKGVMVEHGNVVSFFVGMDERIPHQTESVWLAVTSLSFDISVLELLWTLCRGLTVVVHGADDAPNTASTSTANINTASTSTQAAGDQGTVNFSLFYFSADQGSEQPYRLLMEGARYADQNGFAAVWTPERHFHEFGGLYPNPAVTGAALAAATDNIAIRAGSVVAPLHSPVRIAEDWSVVDNLSNGRAGVAFASGWMPEDFVIRPDDYANKKEATFNHLDVVRRLWRGESVAMASPDGEPVEITTLPRPVQDELPCWITTAGNPETFELAGRAGANVLTHLLGQSVDELADRIAVYRNAWTEAGHTGSGGVTVMLHTLVGSDHDETLDVARRPMRDYLASSTNLLRNYASSFPTFRGSSDAGFDELPDEQMDALLDHAVDRHLETSGLFGTPATCQQRVDELVAIGVDEIACLIDFGVDTDRALAGLEHLNQLRSNQLPGKQLRSTQPTSSQPARIAQPVAALIERHRVTHFQCTPSMARMLLADETEQQALTKLEVMMVGGEASSPALVNQLTELVPGPVLNMYGPTETTIWSLTHHLEGGSESVPIGRPVANTKVYVVNSQLQAQPVGVPGELLIGGPGVTRGYHERADLTKDRFVVNPFDDPAAPRLYRTGDLVRYRDDGVIEFLGRLDHQVKIRGHRIELGEIEAVLNRHQLVTESVVMARQDSGLDKRLVAYVTTTPDAEVDDVSESDLKRSAAQALPGYMVPARVIVVDSFPQTPNGKIDRARLPEPNVVADGQSPPAKDHPPEGATEQTVAALWGEILGRSDIGRNDDFFDLGGDSLSLIEVTSDITDHFGVHVSVAQFLADPTVAGVTSQLEVTGTSSSPDRAAVDKTHGSPITTRLMTYRDIADIIPLHLRYFPNWRVSKLGPGFLQRMYRWYLETHPTLALVAVDRAGTVIGFTVGTVGPYKQQLFAASWARLALGLIRNPGALTKGSSLSTQQDLPAEDSIRAADPALANNRIMALGDVNGGGGYELLVAFEQAARELGTEPYFHTGQLH